VCGVFGIHGHPEAANLTYLGLHALQHRGQESAGIVTTDGERLFAHRNRETIVNPTLLVEVLSPSTEAWDRGGKFDNYQQVESLREYVLVSVATPRVEVFFRQPDGTWRYSVAAGLESAARLDSIGVELPLSEVYSDVEFQEPKRRPESGAI
jgi:Uma2 family endonuclease